MNSAAPLRQWAARVQGFQEGMRVVANNSAPCHHCYYCRRHLANLCEDLLFLNGAYAEYIAVPERIVQTNLAGSFQTPCRMPQPV